MGRSTMMLFFTLAAASLLLLSGTCEARSVALPSPQCHPSVVNTMKPRIRQICKALEAIWQFSDVMENYLDEKEAEEMMSMQRQLMNEAPLMNPGVKRKGEDVDHVFLRFGKRSA